MDVRCCRGAIIQLLTVIAVVGSSIFIRGNNYLFIYIFILLVHVVCPTRQGRQRSRALLPKYFRSPISTKFRGIVYCVAEPNPAFYLITRAKKSQRIAKNFSKLINVYKISNVSNSGGSERWFV